MFCFRKKTSRGRYTFPTWQLETLPVSASHNHLSAACVQRRGRGNSGAGWLATYEKSSQGGGPSCSVLRASLASHLGTNSYYLHSQTHLYKTECAMRTKRNRVWIRAFGPAWFFPFGQAKHRIKVRGVVRWLECLPTSLSNSPGHLGWKVTFPGQGPLPSMMF